MAAEQGWLPAVPRPPQEPVPAEAPAGPPAVPRLRPIDRAQSVFRTVVVEDLIPEDHSARAIWTFVGQLDLTRFRAGIRAVEGTAGRRPYDPHLLVSLWIYSYSRGVNAAREIERRCAHDPAYQWLTGMETVGAHTLSDFRVAHGEALQELFIQVLAVLSAEGLVPLARVMQDGTKIRAAAASKRFRRQPRIEAALTEARAVVAAVDAVPDPTVRAAQQRARARAARDRVRRLETARQTFDALAAARSTVDRVSTTDPDARIMKFAEGGTAPGYNVQVSTDAAAGVIVGVDVTQAGSDYQQLTPALDRLADTLSQSPAQVVVDGGYISADNIVTVAARGIDLVGPSQDARQSAAANPQKSYAARGVTPAYEAPLFRFDAATNTYQCPQGQVLRYNATEIRDGMQCVRYKAAADTCRACPAKAACCPRTRTGRSIEHREPLPALTAFRARMQTDEARAIYRTRAQVAEFPNLWIKTKLGVRQFRLRGLAKVRLEATWAALTYDIQQWIRLRWGPQRATATATT
jgi:transposase